MKSPDAGLRPIAICPAGSRVVLAAKVRNRIEASMSRQYRPIVEQHTCTNRISTVQKSSGPSAALLRLDMFR